MAEQQKQKPLADDQSVTSMKVLGIHLLWFVLGPVALFVILFSIVNAGTGWVTLRDIAFYGVVALIIFARWADQKSGQCTTSEGKPSSWKDFQQYVIILSVFALGAWLVAKAIGYWFFASKAFL